MSAPVWIRGTGATSSLGRTWPETAARLATGEIAIGPIRRFDASGFPCGSAAEIDCDEPDRRRAFALAAAREAWDQARLDASPSRIGVFLGAESGRIDFAAVAALARRAARSPTGESGGGRVDHAALAERARALAPELASARTSAAAPASLVAGAIGARGPVATVSLACASGSAAIAEAVRAIRAGECDVALAGGVGADVDPLMLAGFGLLGALSERGRSRPFDVRRDGFVLGEGAAMVVLARERGDAACAVIGVGRSLDGWRLTAPDPAGSGARRAIRAALDDAGIARVDYVQAHGTSTPLNDAIEAAALRDLDGARVSSVKGALGHWIAGAGALGTLCAFEAIARGTVLPTAGLVEPDPVCALRHVLATERADIRAALVDSFGFGGANCALVLGGAA